jgi:hypothetical protein
VTRQAVSICIARRHAWPGARARHAGGRGGRARGRRPPAFSCPTVPWCNGTASPGSTCSARRGSIFRVRCPPTTHAARLDGRAPLAPGDTVVVTGAELLLSEEFRARVTVGDESGE